MTSRGRVLSWQGYSLAGLLLILAFFLSTNASANHSLKQQVSLGQINGNGANHAFFDAASQDGTRVFFETDEQLTSGDTDSNFDIYERSSGTTTLISIGPNGGNGNNDVFFDGISNDGSRVFFETDEKLINGDNDNAVDIFQRSGGTTTNISGGGSPGSPDAFFDGNSTDGSHVFFDTEEALLGSDTDVSTDIYEYDQSGSPTTRQVSTGGNGAFFATYTGTSADGSVVFFETAESLLGGDTDSSTDVYQRANGTTTSLVSGGSGAFNAFFDGSSADGSKVFFSTSEALSGTGDSDSNNDVYQRSGGLTLISTGTTTNGAFSSFFEGSSQDGAKVFFRTAEKVESTDTDSSNDIWQRQGSTTTQISTGTTSNGAFTSTFDGNSTDGSKIWFSTAEKVETTDTDSSTDVWERSGGSTTQLSRGATGGNGAFPAFWEGASTDGSRVFLSTAEKLESPDTDSATDIYERNNSTTTEISLGAPGGNGSFSAFYVGASADGTRAFIDTQESLLPSDTDSSIDVYVAIVVPFDAPTGGTPARVPLVPAFNECTSSNSTHGGGLPNPASCSNPSTISSTATLGSSTTLGTRVGFARIDVCLTNTAAGCTAFTSGQVPDVRLSGNGSDVVCKAGASALACPGGAGSDYDPDTTAGPYGAGLTTGTNSNKDAPTPICVPGPPNPPACAAGADMTAKATIPDSTNPGERAIRITDSWNDTPSTNDPVGCAATTSCSGTVRDQGFPIPVVCQSNGTAGLGSYCGVQTSANALVPGVVAAGKRAVIEFGEIQIFDSGPDGTRANGDDQLFAVQGVFMP